MSELVWFPDRGYGVLDHPPIEYGPDYFQIVRRKSESVPGLALNGSRCQLVEKYWHGDILDVGVGSGAFLERWGLERGYGYDVADEPRAWLGERGILRDPHERRAEDLPPVFTCFDSLEHGTENDARALLAKCRQLVFVSVPIFERAEDVLGSRHFKPGEHILYFSEPGLIRFMKESGFLLLERNRMEEAYGREGVGSYAFYRA